MKAIPQLKSTRVWVAGAARSGVGAAQILKKMGADVFVSDASAISADAKNSLQNIGVDFEENGHSFDRFEQEAQLLVISPAILLDRGLALHARKHGIPIVSEIEVAAWTLSHDNVCGITGTNGKSTTTHYLAQLLSRGGFEGMACGNIGTPFTLVTGGNSTNTAFAVELSSYQLETTYSLRPKVTVLLNLQMDHQARYENLDDYLKAKWRLVLLTADNGFACVDIHCFERAVKLGMPLPRAQVILLNSEELTSRTMNLPPEIVQRLNFSQTLPIALYHDLRKVSPSEIGIPASLGFACAKILSDRSLKVCISAPQINVEFHVQSPCLPGNHNAENILAASVAALVMGVSSETVRAQWEKISTQYKHLPHRLEHVQCPAGFQDSQSKTHKVALVNDSKATNVESVIVAVKAYDKPIRLLLGGDPKGESYAPLAAFTEISVVKFYTFGKAGPAIYQELSEMGVKNIAKPLPSLFSAAQQALDESADGDIVLLSPACASFDEFKNFEHRGDKFREWALSRQSTGVTNS